MPVNTYVDRARTRTRTEQETVDEKLGAIDAFVDRVSEIPTDSVPSSTAKLPATDGGLVRAGGSTGDRCRVVRSAFAETIGAHVADVDDEDALLAAIGDEFSEEIAVALASTTPASFTPNLKRAVVSEATTRRAETAVLRRALGREATHLDGAGAVVDDVTAWIADADETPLTDLGFDALQQRHETLARHRDRCTELAAERQAFLRETTNQGVDAGIRHRSLVPSLYEDFPVDHPLLATVARLDDACADCQRAVRRHLIRRA